MAYQIPNNPDLFDEEDFDRRWAGYQVARWSKHLEQWGDKTIEAYGTQFGLSRVG